MDYTYSEDYQPRLDSCICCDPLPDDSQTLTSTSTSEMEVSIQHLKSEEGESPYNDILPEDAGRLYRTTMEPLRFATVNMKDDQGNYSNYFLQYPNVNEPPGPEFSKRINLEIKAMMKGLPAESTHAVFVRMDETDQRIMKAFISGAEGTYYEHGLYEFDIVLPNDFPNSPPKINLMRSSNFYFGPNLYQGGYVCLSIVGTWGGGPEESWSPAKNLLQVFLSIQSLVMDNCIAAKEPGYEYMENDPSNIENLSYGRTLRIGNIKYAIIDPLRNPTPGFEQVIKDHFFIKRHQIRATLAKWLEEAKELGDTIDWGSFSRNYNNTYVCDFENRGYYTVLKAAVDDCLEVLAALEYEKLGTYDQEHLPILLANASDKYQEVIEPIKYSTSAQLPNSSEQSSTCTPEFTQRIGKEIKSLIRGLPSTSTNAIFVRQHETNADQWYSLLSGAEGTYYEHGLYAFRINLPNNYPISPPSMNLDNGYDFAFGPNLYQGGYVCLSIIGTWSGGPEESWNSDKNILQVLLSIQSLVMDNTIPAKEPGQEFYEDDPNDLENLVYGRIVRYGSVKYAMTEILQNPPAGFEDVVRHHFYYKRHAIRDTFERWLKEAKEIEMKEGDSHFSRHYNDGVFQDFVNNGYYNVLKGVTDEFLEQLRKLEMEKFDEIYPPLGNVQG